MPTSWHTRRRPTMIGDAFVFDGVAHLFNFDAKNPLGRPGEMFSQHIYAFHQALTPASETVLPPEEFLRQWTVEDVRHMVYDESDTDMLCAMALRLTHLYNDGPLPCERGAEL